MTLKDGGRPSRRVYGCVIAGTAPAQTITCADDRAAIADFDTVGLTVGR